MTSLSPSVFALAASPLPIDEPALRERLIDVRTGLYAASIQPATGDLPVEMLDELIEGLVALEQQIVDALARRPAQGVEEVVVKLVLWRNLVIAAEDDRASSGYDVLVDAAIGDLQRLAAA